MYITAGRFLTLTFDRTTVGEVDYTLNIYSSVDSIARHLLEFSEDEMHERLETEFDMDFYPLETDPSHDLEKNSANEYMRASFNISSLLAQGYNAQEDLFFEERSEDFQGFAQELGDFGKGYKSEHLIQYVNLYSAIVEEEALEIEIDPSSIVLQNLGEKKQTVEEMLSGIEDEVSSGNLE